MAERSGIMIYFDILPQLDMFSNDEAGQIFKAMLNYAHYGEVPEFQDRAMKTLWISLKDKLDRDNKAFQDRCEQNRRNALKRAQNEQRTQATAATASDCSQLQPEPQIEPEPQKSTSKINNQREIEREKEKEGCGEKRKDESLKPVSLRDRERDFEYNRNKQLARLDALTG